MYKTILYIFFAITLNTETFCTNTPNQKVLIMTPAYNRADFIKFQAQSFKKYLKDDYEFIVLNDAQNEDNLKSIVDTCTSLNIPCVRVPQENREVGATFSWASYRHAQAIDFMMQTIGCKHNGIVVLIDSDMFLIKDFSVNTYMKGYDIAGLSQGRPGDLTEYMWAGLIFFNMNTLPNKETIQFSPIVTDTVQLDSGGSMHYYFQANPSVKKRYFNQAARINLDRGLAPRYHYACPYTSEYLKCQSCSTKETTLKCPHPAAIFKELGFRKEIIDLIHTKQVPWGSEFLLEDTFFHAVAGSGYVEMGKAMMSVREKLTTNFLNYMLK